MIWSYLVGGAVLAIGLVTIFLRGDLQKAEDSTSCCCSGLAVALREISFGGALPLAACLTGQWRERATRIQAAIARYFVAIPVLFFSFEQFLHGNYVPGIPLNRVSA